MKIYTGEIRRAMAGSVDTGKLAEAWLALHPETAAKSAPGASPAGNGSLSSPALGLPGSLHHDRMSPVAQGNVTKALNPVLSAFLGAAARAIAEALRGVLTRLWTEGWVLGNRSAMALVDALSPDWGGWTPGDYAAAQQIAGVGLRDLLSEYGVRIKSIADSRLEELSAVLEETLRSDAIRRTPGTEPLPPFLSVGDLAARLESVLDNPANAELVAQAEIARAQATAARQVYAETGRTEVEVSTAEDDRVCPACEAAEKLGPHPIGTPPLVPLHPRCRCAELPVLSVSGGA